ncbi:hypothetical protein SAMN05444000_10925 [Shimia gijangensis]|uniref:Uncharacterized protein n=1 Tax=Shimia gijangensis TaxID=1470563 RepID=A0A1M6JHT8_9RHOB|nr:hypothetical protein SAMN05444000_10925 [Shimia gijangensis]
MHPPVCLPACPIKPVMISRLFTSASQGNLNFLDYKRGDSNQSMAPDSLSGKALVLIRFFFASRGCSAVFAQNCTGQIE